MVYHIQPINDTHEHVDSSVCACEPRVQLIDGNMLVIHNSFDGRELLEQIEAEINDSDKG